MSILHKHARLDPTPSPVLMWLEGRVCRPGVKATNFVEFEQGWSDPWFDLPSLRLHLAAGAPLPTPSPPLPCASLPVLPPNTCGILR